MLDLDSIRQRLEAARQRLTRGEDGGASPSDVELLRILVGDLTQLVHEVDALRDLCPHACLLELYDEHGQITGRFVCVNCHRTIDPSAQPIEAITAEEL